MSVAPVCSRARKKKKKQFSQSPHFLCLSLSLLSLYKYVAEQITPEFSITAETVSSPKCDVESVALQMQRSQQNELLNSYVNAEASSDYCIMFTHCNVIDSDKGQFAGQSRADVFIISTICGWDEATVCVDVTPYPGPEWIVH